MTSRRLKSLLLPAVMLFLVSASEPPQNKITVAVYPVKVLAVEKSYESLGPILTSFLVTKLSKSAKLKVTEQEMTAEVEKQLEFANSDKCDANMCPIPEIGKSVAAQKLVVGQVAKLGSKYTADIRVIDIEKKLIDFSVEEQLVCKEEDLDQLMELTALDLREKFGEKIDRPHTSAQPQSSPVSAPSPSYSADPLDRQNILGIVVENAPERQGEGVIIKSVLPECPCKDILKPGNLFTYMNPQGKLTGLRSTDAPYHISDLNDFRKLVATIKPGDSVGFMIGATIAHRAYCAIPSSPLATPQTPAPPAEPAAPEKKAKKARE